MEEWWSRILQWKKLVIHCAYESLFYAPLLGSSSLAHRHVDVLSCRWLEQVAKTLPTRRHQRYRPCYFGGAQEILKLQSLCSSRRRGLWCRIQANIFSPLSQIILYSLDSDSIISGKYREVF